MKTFNSIFVALCLLFSLTAFAQEETIRPPSEEVNDGVMLSLAGVGKYMMMGSPGAMLGIASYSGGVIDAMTERGEICVSGVSGRDLMNFTFMAFANALTKLNTMEEQADRTQYLSQSAASVLKPALIEQFPCAK